jgi:aspartate aminotransferase-like enzyme
MEVINFIPGPVMLNKSTLAAVAQTPLSHREEDFKKMFAETSAKLCALVKAKNATLFMGSGTLANDVIAAQLSLLKGRGLIVSNGEFGERLSDQAKRFCLDFTQLKYAWGDAFDYSELENSIYALKPAWIWFAHLETSTGILNDLEKITKICAATGTKICVDVISTIGNINLDLSNIYLAAASSGKGLAALSGISIVFGNGPAIAGNLPKYLDLSYYNSKQNIPFTFSSNLLFALHKELQYIDMESRIQKVNGMSLRLQQFLEGKGFVVVGKNLKRAQYIVTVSMPKGKTSQELGLALAQKNIRIHYKNDYLREHNWIQISLMGYPLEENLAELFKAVSALNI